MRALLVVRPTAATKPGGDVALAERLAASLATLDVTADVVATLDPDARGYDVAHVFGIFISENARSQITAIRAHGTPLVLSPIFWDRRDFLAVAPRFARALDDRRPERAARSFAWLRANERRLALRHNRVVEKVLKEQADLLGMCDVALPASDIEAFVCANTLGVLDVPFVVARYGADHGTAGANAGAERRGVLCVGRIEPLKNQAALLYALRDVDVDVTILGRSFNPEYLALCQRLATPRTHFVEGVEREELDRMLAATAVHVLPSWADLPGLVSLEAASMGARVVVGSRGSEHEYFGPGADYVNPADPASIRAAVLRALARGPRDRPDELDRRLEKFTWRRHAEITLEAYGRAMRRSG